MSSGPGSSGKPWPRLIALLSRASCDIASKMVTGRSAKTLFIEVEFLEVMFLEVMATISRWSWWASPRPSSPVFPPRDACRKQNPRPAPPMTRSPIVCRSGRQKPPACHRDREYPAGRNPKAEPRQHRDRLPPRLHSARGRRPEDSARRRSPWIHLPASNREPDDPSRKILPARRLSSAIPPQAYTGWLAHQTRLSPAENQAPGTPWMVTLDGHLGPDFDHTAGGNLEIVGGVVGGAAQRNEQMVLPARHPRMG